MSTPPVFDFEVNAFKGIKKIWAKIRNTKLFKWFRGSRLNPYHWGLEDIKAKTGGVDIYLSLLLYLKKYYTKKDYLSTGGCYFSKKNKMFLLTETKTYIIYVSTNRNT